MTQLARYLTGFAERLVKDETGLPGGYDFVFVWVPGPEAPFLSTALDDQLGLKLVPSERPVEFLVIDQVQQPTPD